MAVYANYEFVANTTKSEEKGCDGSYPLASEYERGKVSYNPAYPVFELFLFLRGLLLMV
jgi:hypothetical protein